MRASPPRKSLWASRSSSESQPVEFRGEAAVPSKEEPSVSFGAPADDRMSITALRDELGSGEEDSAALPPSGKVALPKSDPELTAMLFLAAESVGLQWKALPSPECSNTG